MVSGHHDLDDTVDVESGLEPAEGSAPAARRRRLAGTGAGLAQRRPCIVQRRVAPRRGPARATVADGGAPPPPAAGAPAWPPGLWPCALAEAGGGPAGRRHHGPRCGARGRRRLRGGMGRRDDPRGGHPRAGALRGPRMRRRRRSHRLDRRAARDGKRLSIMAGSTDVGLLRRLLGQARPYWPHVGALLLLSLLASPLSLLAPLPLKIAVDSVIGSPPLPWVIAPVVPEAIARSAGGVLGLAVGLVLAVALLSQLQSRGSTLLQAWVQERLVLEFRARLFRHVQRVSLAYHDTRGTTDSTYRIQRDAQAIQHILTEGLIPLVSATVTFIAMIYVMARIDGSLALIALAISPSPVVIARAFRRRLRRHRRQAKKLESATQSIVQEVLGALRIVKAFGQEAREEQRFLGRSTDGMSARMRVARLESSYQFLVGLTTAVGTAAVLLTGIGHVRSGAQRASV